MEKRSTPLRAWQSTERTRVEQHQLRRLNQLLATILPHNQFYRDLFGCDRLELQSLAELSSLPLVTKEQLIGTEPTGIARHHTWPYSQYCRLHRTSGTRGHPLTILDTDSDWRWWIETWQYVLDAAEVTAQDRALMAFSFGPFIGFWSGFDALAKRGALLIPAGGISSMLRLKLAMDTQATVLCCTPTYALHLATVAHEEGIDLTRMAIRRIIVAGEPGGSLPAVRQRIEVAWNAKVIDHAGATEVGPWGVGDQEGNGVHVIESEFIPEILDLRNSSHSSGEHRVGELVLTSLGRTGAPAIRYRTGDFVRGRTDRLGFLFLEGGVVGRVDDMFVVRGVNVFPSAIEAIVRELSHIDEYRLVVRREREMDQLEVQVEGSDEAQSRALEVLLEKRLALRIPVVAVPRGTLPRSEGKGGRLLDLRNR
jgi:phenylacetate-CoA ligase